MQLGHIFTIVNPYEFENFDQANAYLVSLVNGNKGHWDLFMNAYGANFLFIDTIKEIKKYGIPSLLICCDNLHAPFMHKSIAPFFDLVW